MKKLWKDPFVEMEKLLHADVLTASVDNTDDDNTPDENPNDDFFG